VIVATRDAYALAEGPRWDAARRRLIWVDILGGAVLVGELDDDGPITVTSRHDFDCMVGAAAFADDGTLLVAAQEELVVVHPDGSREHAPRVVPAGQGRRMNDGAVDPGGRFVVGTLALDGPSEREELIRLEHDGSLTVLDDDLTLSNGLAWSSDGARMYSVDTLRRLIYVRERDDDRRLHLTIEHGHPDGIAIDADDHLWVALWGAGAVHRYSPDGELVDRLDVPAPHTTAMAFAGEDLRTLVITTAYDQLTDEQRTEFPDSGRLFTSRTDVAGLPPTAWEKT
jgi:sugar lactone lactonase YvrE